LPQICPVPTFLSCYGFYPFLSPRTHCVSIAKSMVRLTDPPTTGSIQSTSALPSNSCSARSARCERGQPRNRCLHCSFSPACLFFFFCSRCIPDDVYICDIDGNGISDYLLLAFCCRDFIPVTRQLSNLVLSYLLSILSLRSFVCSGKILALPLYPLNSMVIGEPPWFHLHHVESGLALPSLQQLDLATRVAFSVLSMWGFHLAGVVKTHWICPPCSPPCCIVIGHIFSYLCFFIGFTNIVGTCKDTLNFFSLTWIQKGTCSYITTAIWFFLPCFLSLFLRNMY
jgi:hypothetical protein